MLSFVTMLRAVGNMASIRWVREKGIESIVDLSDTERIFITFGFDDDH